MIIHPYITRGNIVLYSPEGRADVQITVTVHDVLALHDEAVVKYADGTFELVGFARISPMPAERMKPVASIRQVVREFEKNGGDVSRLGEFKRKHVVAR